MAETKATLAERLFDELGLNKREAKEMVELFFEEIQGSLEMGDQVKISSSLTSPIVKYRLAGICGNSSLLVGSSIRFYASFKFLPWPKSNHTTGRDRNFSPRLGVSPRAFGRFL